MAKVHHQLQLHMWYKPVSSDKQFTVQRQRLLGRSWGFHVPHDRGAGTPTEERRGQTRNCIRRNGAEEEGRTGAMDSLDSKEELHDVVKKSLAQFESWCKKRPGFATQATDIPLSRRPCPQTGSENRPSALHSEWAWEN